MVAGLEKQRIVESDLCMNPIVFSHDGILTYERKVNDIIEILQEF